MNTTLSSPMKLPELKVLNLENMNLSHIDIKETAAIVKPVNNKKLYPHR